MPIDDRSADAVNKQPIGANAVFVKKADGSGTKAWDGALGGGESHIGEVGGRLAVASATFQRPGDTTAYVAGDVVSNSTVASSLMELEIARVNGGSGWLEKVRLITNNKNTTARFRVWFYKISNPAVAVDNAKMTLLWANRENRLGYIDLPPMATEDAASDSASALASPGNSANLPFTFVTGELTRKLFVLLETLDGFAPAANQQFFFEVTASLN